ncbi:MAG: SLBB domain-containing protein [Armatimonadota bacterium]
MTIRHAPRIRASHLLTVSGVVCLLVMAAAGAVALPEADPDHFLVVFESDTLPESIDLSYAQGTVTARPPRADRPCLVAELPRVAMGQDGSFTLQPAADERQMDAWRIYVLPGWPTTVLRGREQGWLREQSLCFEEGQGNLPGRLTLDRYPPMSIEFEEGRIISARVSDAELLQDEESGFVIGDDFELLEGTSQTTLGVSRLTYEDPEAPRNTLEVVVTPTEPDRVRFDCRYTVEQPRDESVPVHLVLRPEARLRDMRGYSWRGMEEVAHTLEPDSETGQTERRQFINLAQAPFARVRSDDGSWLGVLDHDQANVILGAGADARGQQSIHVTSYLWPRERRQTYEWSFELIGGWAGDYNALLQALTPHTRDFEESYAGAMVDQDRAGDFGVAYDHGARVLWHDEWFRRVGAYFDSTRSFDEMYQTPWGASFSYARLQSNIEAARDAGISPHVYIQFAGASEDIADRFSDAIVRGADGEMIVADDAAGIETVWANPDPRGAWGSSMLRQVDALLEATGAAGIALDRTDRLDSAFELDAYDFARFNGYSSLLEHQIEDDGGDAERRPVSSVTIAGREWMTELRAILDKYEAALISSAPTSPRVVRLSEGVLLSDALNPESLFFMKALSNGKSLYLSDTRDEFGSSSDEPFQARLVQARPYLTQGANWSEPDRMGRLLYAISEDADYPSLWYFDTGHTRMNFNVDARTVPAMFKGSRFESVDERQFDATIADIARGGAAPAAQSSQADEDSRTPGERFAQLPRFGAQIFGAEPRSERDDERPTERDEDRERTERSEDADDGESSRARTEVEGSAAVTEGVPPTYVIGPGDELAVRVWTDRIEHINATPTVDADGNIYVELIGAVNVAGETISEVRNDLSERFSHFFDRAEVNVGLARTRVIEVRVTGDVTRPGKYRLSGAVTVFSALYAADGPSEVGSLRRVRLIRSDEPAVEIDLYDYLLEGDPRGDLSLRPEDTVFVAPAGPTVGITGEIQRPARYELAAATTLPELIEMAGGLASGAHTRGVQIWRVGDDGERELLNVNLAEATRESVQVRGGDLVVIPSVLEESLSTIEVAGPVRRPGDYQHREGLTVSELIEDAQGLTTEAHAEEAQLWRLNDELDYEISTIDLRAALRGEASEDRALAPGDRLVVLSEHDVEAPMLVSVEGAVRNPRSVGWNRGMRVSDLVKQAGGLIEGAYTDRANLMRIGDDQRRHLVPVELGAAVGGDRQANVELQRGDILQVLVREEVSPISEVHVTGLVQEEGWYDRPQGMRVSDAILAAGGLVDTADGEVQYTPGGAMDEVAPIYLSLERDGDRFEVEPDPVLQDNDLVAVLGTGRLVTSPGSVTIRGHVDKPGAYALESTADDPDTVYDVIQRAGDLLPNANPHGIVLYRLREEIISEDQEEDLSQMIDHLNRELAAGTVEGEEQRAAGTAAQISAGLQTALSEGTATVVIPPRQLDSEQWARAVPIDGAALIESAGEREDFPVSDGDVIIVPETPTTVTVLGAVGRSGAVRYEEGLKPTDYIGMAGDFGPDAHRRRTVVIRANGEVTPNGLRAEIRPGDIILVPSDYIFRDVNEPGTLERVLSAVTSIIGGYLIFR